MRTFIALELPSDFADDVAGMARTLSAGIEGRFLERDTYHVTLAFLGNIDDADVSRAMDALDEAVEAVGLEADAGLESEDTTRVPPSDESGEPGEQAASGESDCATKTIPLIPDGLGKFRHASDATLWLGLDKAAPLMALAESLREGLRERGLAFDDKPFLPHITIARRTRLPKGPLPQLAFPHPANAIAVTLFKSTLERDGAIYKPLYSRELPE